MSSRAQSPDTLTIYGPRRFDRVSGPPTTASEQFSLPSDSVPPFTILVQNGDSNGSNRVSSATITLNGTDVFTQRDFNQNSATLNKEVSLIASNSIAVRLSSAPGSFLTITVASARSSLASISPANGTQGQSVTVSLHGTNTRWVVGQTRATFGAEVSVGGAAAGAPGPCTVVDSVTATAQLSISSTASLGPRIVQVSTTIPAETREELELLIDGFKVVPVTPPGAASTTVSTLAGVAGFPGFADGPSSQAKFRDLAGLAVGPDDSIYVADAGNNRIRRIASDGTVTTVAGDGMAGFVDGPGTSARFDNPQGVAVDSSGMIYVADTGNNRIRRIAVDGTVATLAGGGATGFQDGAGSQARFNAPRGVALDNQGNAYVADTGNSSVRAVTPSGNVSTVAGDGTIGFSDSPARFDGLVGITVEGTTLFVYVADTGNHRIRRLAPSGATITIAGADRGFADGSGVQARFAEPSGIAVDAAGKLVVADATNSLVRFVDPGGSGLSPAVSTLAGTGDRGLTNGSGTVARFFNPRGIAVAQSSAIIVADTGNHVLRRVLLPPSIASFTPTRANAGNSVTITGERFDGRAPSRNTVRFTKAAGELTDAVVTFASRTQLMVTVPADATAGPITVQTEGGTTISAANFEVIANTPIISDFNPKNGSVGTEVTLTGTALKADTGPTVITFAGGNNSRLPALVTFVTPTSVRVLVPNGAVTGVIDLANNFGHAATTTAFTVDPGQNDYRLTIAPSSTTAVQGSTATFVVFLTSPSTTFSQLVSLTATGLPQGATAEFNPQQITAGALSTVSVKLTGTNPGPGSYSLTIRGSGLVDGSELVRTATATLSVIAAGQTTLSGRVLSTESEPIMGATVSLDGKTATTDAAGAFLLIGVTAGVDRPLMVDGRTASAPNRTYPLIIEPAVIVAGQANTVPYTFYLPAIDTQFEVDVVPGQNTLATNPRVPGLQMTIPPDAHLRNRDGSPVARVSITPLAIDRTPAPLPSSVGTNLVYTSQPGGAISDVAMPVVYPNLAGADPGTRIELYSFNHDTVQWYVYGFGRVSVDGRRIEPEIDPATGRLFGLPDFSWHFPNAAPNGNPGEDDPCGDSTTGNPVDLSTGMKIEPAVDIAFGGARGGLILARVYTSDLMLLGVTGRFGRGTRDNYDIRLTGTFSPGGAGRLVTSEEGTGRLYSYVRTDGDGSLVFATSLLARRLGDVLRKLSGGTFEYRSSDGSVMRFDSDGKLTATVDLNGNTSTFTYTGSNLTRVTDPVGRSITLEYDGSNRIIRATDPLARVWQYFYDSGGRLNKVLDPDPDPSNRGIVYGYDGAGKLTSITDKRGIVAKRIVYDGNSRVIRQEFAASGFDEYQYTLSGTTVTGVTITDSLGRTVSQRFNARGQVLETRDPLGQMSRIERDLTTGLPTTTVGPCGCPEVTRQYDERGNITALTDRLGQATRFEYDPAFSRITRTTDRLNRVTRFDYDSRGNLTAITDPLNQVTSLTYDAFGQPTAVTNPMSHTVRFEYDAYGNVSASIDPLGHRSVIEHDILGRPTAFVDALGRRGSQTFDALDRVTQTIDSAGTTSRFTFDPSGNLLTAENGLGQRVTSVYDAKNRPVTITDHIGRVSRFEYNTEDELTAILSPSGRTARYAYDVRGELLRVTDPLGGQVRYTYDNRGNLSALVDERGNTTTYSYDELYRPLGRRDPLGRSSSVRYDAVGNVIESADRLGHRVNITYDALDRVRRATFADAVVDYAYDAASRLTRIDDSQSGSMSWSYDDANRLVSETRGADIVQYAYNIANQINSMTAADRPAVSYSYDPAGRLRTITQGAETFTYSYDALSRVISLQRPNGVASSFSYDSVSRLIRLLHSTAQAQRVEDYTYTYNADDEIASISSLSSSHLLPAEKSIAAADAANRITQSASTTFAFDDEGQTSSKTDAQGASSYQWDARGRLIRATLPGGQTVNYSYDPLGRLSSRSASGVASSFLYDGADIVLDRVSDGSVIDYLNGAGVDDKLRQVRSGSAPLYFLQDHLGSTAALLDSNAAVVERVQYEPFGLSAGSAFSRYGFTGREHDQATGLIYMRARWYDPKEGRFITQDPIGFGGGDTNLYAYVGNDPINQTDVFGLSSDRGFWTEDLDTFIEKRVEPALEFLDELSERLEGPSAANIKGPHTDVELPDDPCFEFDSSFGAQQSGLFGGLAKALLKNGLKDLFKRRARALRKAALARVKRLAKAEATRVTREGRLRQLADDSKLGSRDRGWIKNEIRQVEEGNRTSLHNPPGKDLRHPPGRSNAQGYDYSETQLQDRATHRTQHRYLRETQTGTVIRRPKKPPKPGPRLP